MEAHQYSLKFITETSFFKIPFFQRSYVWDTDNWDSILSDFMNRENQFLGSIILKHLVKKTNDAGSRALVIDGQQRLTTLSILIKAVVDSLGDTAAASQFAYPFLFYRPRAIGSRDYLRMEHSRVDRGDFEFVIRSSRDDIVKRKGDSKIIRCYRHFLNELAKFTAEERSRLFDRLVNPERDDAFLVVIDLSEQDDEQLIFDTINSAGVRLSCADTIKNLVFKVAIEKAELVHCEQKVYDIYDECWSNEFEDDEERRDYWLREAQSVRVKRTMLEMFLHSFAIMKKFYDPRENNLGQLPKLYEKTISELSFEGSIDFIRELVNAAEVYRENLGSFGMAKTFCYADPVGRLFHILEQCNVLTFHPYLLHLFFNCQGDRQTLEKRCSDLERFVMRQYVAHWTTRQNNSYCVEFIADANAVKQRGDEIPNEEIEARLRHIGNRQAKLVLFWIELHRRHVDPCAEMRELPFVYQLEHILPQKWEKTWGEVPFVDANGDAVDDLEQGKKERYSKCFEIGNMTLLTGSLNREISNSSFAIKIKGDHLTGRRPRKGMKDYGDLLVTKSDIVVPFDNGEVVWDEARIAKRTQSLIGEFMELWK